MASALPSALLPILSNVLLIIPIDLLILAKSDQSRPRELRMSAITPRDSMPPAQKKRKTGKQAKPKITCLIDQTHIDSRKNLKCEVNGRIIGA